MYLVERTRTTPEGGKKMRQAGILLPVYSLPSKYGCGTLGKEAYSFINWLRASGQSVWQILPVGPANCGDSPYQCSSSFAGNPYFVDFDILKEEGLLKASDYEKMDFGSDPEFMDYEKLKANRNKVLHIAFENGRDDAAFSDFIIENAWWLDDYALYMALKEHFDEKYWLEWPDEALKSHDFEACMKMKELLSERIAYHSFVQFEFFRQWNKMKAYANEQGISIVGDIPIYVPMDCADVWASRGNFLLSEDNIPVEVAGVPPDYFNEDGQLWGNPLYNWDAMRNDGYGWWIRRIGGTLKLCDVIRIDHFRGFDEYWAVPYGAKSAKEGCWRKGPGMSFVGVITSWFGGEHFIAEDLGCASESVTRLLADSGLPGMKVMEFAFNAVEPSSYIPHMVKENCIYYVGTHDNTTIMGWKDEEPAANVELAARYLNLTEEEGFNWGFIRGGMATPAKLFVAQMQDYLALDSHARTNVPGTVGTNWRWRLTPGQLTPELAAKIREVTELYGR